MRARTQTLQGATCRMIVAAAAAAATATTKLSRESAHRSQALKRAPPGEAETSRWSARARRF